MFKRGLPLLVASLLVLLLGAYWALYFTGNNTEYAKGHQYLVTIKPGMTTADIADLLHKKHLVKTPEAFRMEARLRGLAGKLEAGQYEIEGGMSNREIVDILSQGQTYVVKFTVPEGFNVAKTAKKLEAEGLGNAAKFREAARNYTPYPYMETTNPDVAYKAEGFIYPATYSLQPGMSEKDILAVMVKAFNTEMNNVLAGLESEAAQMAAEAKELYAENGTSVFLNGSYWTNELSLTQTYMTEGKLLSIAAENYTYYGGVHPNSATRAWSFDLTTGEFLTLDALASEEGDLQGNSLQESIYWNIYEQIAQKGLSEGYFDDYDSYLQDFPTLATLNFTENGLTVTFDQYVIAPYAAGPQVFSVPYSEFYNALSEHAKTILDVSQEQTVTADFKAAATLWSWFYMDDRRQSL